jgi:hypothetical protein
MGHANDIAYHAGFLYIAPCRDYIVQVNTQNWNFVQLKCDVFVSAIAHYSGNQFIVMCNMVGPIYSLAIVEHIGNKMILKQKWDVNNLKAEDGYTISQGIGFKKKTNAIFVVLSRQDFCRNIILRSKVNAIEPTHCFRSMKKNEKYEFEGISFNSKGRYIIGSNLPNGKDSTFIA